MLMGFCTYPAATGFVSSSTFPARDDSSTNYVDTGCAQHLGFPDSQQAPLDAEAPTLAVHSMQHKYWAAVDVVVQANRGTCVNSN